MTENAAELAGRWADRALQSVPSPLVPDCASPEHFSMPLQAEVCAHVSRGWCLLIARSGNEEQV